MALPPQSGDGGVELPTAERLHGRGRRQEVPPGPQQHFAAAAGALPLHALLLRQHAERQVAVGDVDVAGVVPFVGVILAALPVPPRVRLVPVVGADRHRDQPQRAGRQEQTRRGEGPHRGHVPRVSPLGAAVTPRDGRTPLPAAAVSGGGAEGTEQCEEIRNADTSQHPPLLSLVRHRREEADSQAEGEDNRARGSYFGCLLSASELRLKPGCWPIQRVSSSRWRQSSCSTALQAPGPALTVDHDLSGKDCESLTDPVNKQTISSIPSAAVA